MSKKILKRSLALGALMAFVITGSVYAADTSYEEFIANADSDKNITVNDELVVTGRDKPIDDYKLDVADGGKLTLNEVFKVQNVSGNGDVFINISTSNPALCNGTTFVGKNLYVTAIDDTETSINGRYDRVLSYVSKTVNITAQETVSFDTGDHCIHTEGSDGKVTITAKDVIMKSNQRPIMNSGGADVIVNASNSVYMESAGGIYNWAANQDGKIEIKGKTVELVSPGSYVIQNGGSGVVTVEAEESLIVKSSGSYDTAVKLVQTVDSEGNPIGGKGDIVLKSNGTTIVEGDIINNGRGGDVVASFDGEGSYLTGKVVTSGEGDTNLTFNDATWNVTGESNVSKLNGSGVNVVFDANVKDIHIDAGSASLNLTLADKTADDLNDADGLTTVAKKLGVSKDATETISAKVVMVEGDVKGETTGVVTYIAPEEGATDTYYHGEVTEVTEKVNTKNQVIGDAGISLKLHWRAHVNDMNKRMGELRNADGEYGVWARMVRGESEYENTKAQYNQYQLGYDEKLSVDKRWTVGAAVTFAEGDANYGQGSTDDKSTAFAIYGSKLNNDGTFVDLIARYAHLESDLDDVNSGKGDYATNGMSVSAEFGKRIQQGNGLWVEPQVELTYGTIDSAEFKFEGGKTVEVGDMDSLIGRVGFRVGKDLEQGNVYARASYLYDFEGETENTFSKGNASRTIAEDLGGGWWEVGVGANINLSEATYFYADIEKTFGGEVDTNWQWNLGVRYSF